MNVTKSNGFALSIWGRFQGIRVILRMDVLINIPWRAEILSQDEVIPGREAVGHTRQEGTVVGIRLDVTGHVRVVLFSSRSVTVSV